MNDQPAIGKFGWITLAAFGTVVATIGAYAFTIAMDTPSKRLEDLRQELHRELDVIKNAHARIIARDDIIEARIDSKEKELSEVQSAVQVNTNHRLKGGRFTAADGDRLEKMLLLQERRIDRLEDKVYTPFYRPKILEVPDVSTDG